MKTLLSVISLFVGLGICPSSFGFSTQSGLMGPGNGGVSQIIVGNGVDLLDPLTPDGLGDLVAELRRNRGFSPDQFGGLRPSPIGLNSVSHSGYGQDWGRSQSQRQHWDDWMRALEAQLGQRGLDSSHWPEILVNSWDGSSLQVSMRYTDENQEVTEVPFDFEPEDLDQWSPEFLRALLENMEQAGDQWTKIEYSPSL